MLFSRFTVRNLLLLCGCLWWVCGQGTTSQVDDVSPENWRVNKDRVSEMLISTAVFPPACWTAGSLPSLWLFNAGPSQAQTSWRREAFPLSVRKHRSSATSSLREARLKHSQKMQEDQPDSRICQKPPEFLLAKKKNSREHRGEEWRGAGEKNEEGVKQSARPWDLFFYLFCTDYERSASAR